MDSPAQEQQDETHATKAKRTRRKPAAEQAQETKPDVFDQAIADHQASLQQPTQNGHAAKVKMERVEHSRESIPVGDLIVHRLDKGSNKAGIGILVQVPEGRTRTDDEKEAIRTVMKGETVTGRESPFKWNGLIQPKMWHAEIGYDAPPAKAVAIRLDAESRVHKLADALKHVQADPVGYRQMIEQQRAQAAQSQQIPD